METISANEGTMMHIVFVAPCVNEAFFNPVKKGAVDAGKMMGCSISFIGTEDVDIGAQIELVSQSISQHCAGLAISMPHVSAFNDVVAQAQMQNIPVVSFNIDAPNSRLATVSQSLFCAGELVGQHARNRLTYGASVLITQHSMGISALDERMRGIQSALDNLGLHYDLLITGIETAAAKEKIMQKLAENPLLCAILCTGLADTEGAGAAAAALEGSSPYIAGFDVSPAILDDIEQGRIDCTIDQQPYIQGFYPVIQLVLYNRYGILPTDVDAGAILIDRTNVSLQRKNHLFV